MAQIPDMSAGGNLGGTTEKGGAINVSFCNGFRTKPDNTGEMFALPWEDITHGSQVHIRYI